MTDDMTDLRTWLLAELDKPGEVLDTVRQWLAAQVVGSAEVLDLVRTHPRYRDDTHPSYVTKLIRHRRFPLPVRTLAVGRMWLAVDVVRFLDVFRPEPQDDGD